MAGNGGLIRSPLNAEGIRRKKGTLNDRGRRKSAITGFETTRGSGYTRDRGSQTILCPGVAKKEIKLDERIRPKSGQRSFVLSMPPWDTQRTETMKS